MENKIIVNAAPGTNEIIIREGEALPQPLPREKFDINGNIDTVANFLKKRHGTAIGSDLQAVDPTLAIVVADKENLTIKLMLDPGNPTGVEVSGKMELSPKIAKYRLNTEANFSREQVIKLLRFNRIDFADYEEADKVIAAFQKFSVKGYVDMQNENDQRGNVVKNLNKTATTDLPGGFILKLPIFKGQTVVNIAVDICFDMEGSTVVFWFESMHFIELFEGQKEEIFAANLSACSDFPIIYK